MTHHTMFSILIYLTSALIAVPLAKKFGLGSVLGYLLAGVFIGPFFLNLAGEGENVMHAAEFGVVMMLFMIGLELEPKKLWDLRKSIIGLGGVQVIGSAVLITVTLYFAQLVALREAIALGLMLSLSSTAIIMQSLREKGMSNAPIGRRSFSVLLFQDMAVIPILALLPLLSPRNIETDTIEASIQLTYIFGALALTVFVGFFLIKPFFRFLAQTKLRELFTTASLFLVVGVSLLMETVGVSPALGAFIAGVLLAESEFKHELEIAIEPFKSLMMGVFFIAVGATMNFKLLVQEPAFILASVVGLLVLKGLVLHAIATVSKFNLPLKWSFTLTLPQGGEFAFVLSTFALGLNIFSDATYEFVNIIVAITMLLTPFLMLLDERIIQPKFTNFLEAPLSQQDEEIKEEDASEVVIAGFGRYGQVIGRYLHYHGVSQTLLDLDPTQIEMLRKIGFKVFYGDATRLDLLHAAQLGKAKILVVAVDKKKTAERIIELAQEHFPHVKLFVRAVDRRHAYELTAKGVAFFNMETFHSALNMGVEVLTSLGQNHYEAYKNAQLFEQYDQKDFMQMAEAWLSQKNFFVKERSKIQAQQGVFHRDQHRGRHENASKHWRPSNPNPEISHEEIPDEDTEKGA